MHGALPWIVVALELVGLFLLAREVHRGREAEGLERDLLFARRMLYLYTSKNYTGFLLESRLDQGDSPEQAQAWLSATNPTAIAAAVLEQWSTLGPAVAASLKRWNEKTAPRITLLRKWDLIVGTALLMTAAALHLIE
jgi:hypothetical protein